MPAACVWNGDNNVPLTIHDALCGVVTWEKNLVTHDCDVVLLVKLIIFIFLS